MTIPVPTPDQLITAATTGKSILDFVKTTIDFFKKKDNKGKALETTTTPPLSVRSQLEEVLIIELDGRSYLVHKESVPEQIFEYIRRQKIEKKQPQKIELIKSQNASRIDEISEYVNSNIGSLPAHLNSTYKSLLMLSKYAKEAFDSGNRKLGAKRKSEISIIYGVKGNLFCNLYCQNYIIRAIDHFTIMEKNKLVSKEKINEFIDFILKYWEAVYFVHHFTSVEETFQRVSAAITQSKEYIAVHGIGKSNVAKINEIVVRISADTVLKEKLKQYEIIGKEGNTKDKALPRKDVYFMTSEGKLVYDRYQSI